MKVYFSLGSDKNNGSLHGDQCKFTIISHSVLLTVRNVSEESCRENQNTRFILSNSPPPTENRAVYEVMWKNTAEPGRPHMKT